MIESMHKYFTHRYVVFLPQVATQRINDVIPMMIMHQMVHKLSEDIKIQIRFLGSQPEILKKFEEDPTVALKRRMLRDKLIRLTNAEKELTKF